MSPSASPWLRRASPATASASSPGEVLVRFGTECGRGCSMCPLPIDAKPALAGPGQALAALSFVMGQGAARVLVTGGEPTRNPDFEAALDVLERAGLPWDLCTDGTWFSSLERGRRCRDAGLDRAVVSWHADSDASWQRLSPGGGPDRLALVAAGIRNLASAGVRVLANRVLLAGNLASPETWFAPLLPPTAASLAVKITFPLFARAASDLPTYAHVLPAVRCFLGRAVERGLAPTVEGLPRCLLRPHDVPPLGRAEFGLTHVLEASDDQALRLLPLDLIDAHTRVFAEACVRCAVSRTCCGVERRYAELHGLPDLIPFAGSGPGVPWWASGRADPVEGP